MTYNFDPDRWYDNERAALDLQYQKGHLTEDAYREALAALDARYDDMVRRLDGTYRIPGLKQPS